MKPHEYRRYNKHRAKVIRDKLKRLAEAHHMTPAQYLAWVKAQVDNRKSEKQ